jgi:putative oxidoreductase
VRTTRDYLFGSSTAGPRADIGLLLLRLFAGLALAFAHGLGKLPPSDRFVGWVGSFGFPAPGVFAWLSGITEFFGGILLASGLLTRPAAVFIVINMTVAVIFGHAGQSFGERELPLLFLFVALMFAFVGAGRYSVDAQLRRSG